MKKILFTILLGISLFGNANAQIVVKSAHGYIDTTFAYDSVQHHQIIVKIDTTTYTALGTIVSVIKFYHIDTEQQIVIAEGLYDINGNKISGTQNRYFFYKQRIPFNKLTQMDINILKNN